MFVLKCLYFYVILINDVISITAVYATNLYYEIKLYYGRFTHDSE